MCFEEPQLALTDTARFLAYTMTYGDQADMNIIRLYLSDDELRDAMDSAPFGVFDPRSWAYWNLMLGRFPAPSMPDNFFDMSNSRRSGTAGEFDRGLAANGLPR